MKSKFKFFRGYIGTLDIMDGQTYATASIYNPNTFWTPEEVERIRNQRIQISNDIHNEMLQVYQQNRIQDETRLPELEMNMERISQSIRQIENQQLRLFQATSTITVNPTLWTRVKMFGAAVKLILNESWRADPFGVIFVTLLMCLITFIGIMKLFGA
jgi:hypothetical protein